MSHFAWRMVIKSRWWYVYIGARLQLRDAFCPFIDLSIRSRLATKTGLGLKSYAMDKRWFCCFWYCHINYLWMFVIRTLSWIVVQLIIVCTLCCLCCRFVCKRELYVSHVTVQLCCCGQATGVRLGVAVESLSSVGTGIIIAFVFSWELALFILGLAPAFVVASYLETKMYSGFAGSEELEQAGHVRSHFLRSTVNLFD